MLLKKRGRLEPVMWLPVAVLFSAALGYLTFWFYFVHVWLGVVASFGILLFALVQGLRHIEEARNFVSECDVQLPLILTLAVFLFYTGLVTCLDPASGGLSNSMRTVHNFLPGDNALQLRVTEQLAEGKPLKKLEMGGWLSSDRPPLQSGIVLVQYPFFQTMGLGEDAYQCISVLLQCCWVIAVYFVGRVYGFPSATIGRIILLCAFSGFFFVNSVFVWPKLFAGALFLFGLVWLTLGKSNPLLGLLGGVAMALSFLSHGGAMFGILGFVACLPWMGKRLSLRILLLGGIVAVLMITPWLLYQKLYDPPGDRLLKWHLAGVIGIDGRSFVQALWDSYSTVTWSHFWISKWANLRVILPPGFDFSRVSLKSNVIRHQIFGQFRVGDFFNLCFSLGVLNLGYFSLAIRGFIKESEDRRARVASALVLLSLVSILIWCLLMFLEAGAVIHTGSYGVFMALFVGLGYGLCLYPTRVADFLLGCRVAYFFLTYIIYSAGPIGRIDQYVYFFLVGVPGLFLLYRTLRAWPEEESATPGTPSSMRTSPWITEVAQFLKRRSPLY